MLLVLQRLLNRRYHYRYFHSKMCGGNLLDIQGDYGKSLKGKKHVFLAYTENLGAISGNPLRQPTYGTLTCCHKQRLHGWMLFMPFRAIFIQYILAYWEGRISLVTRPCENQWSGNMRISNLFGNECYVIT